MNDNHNGDGDGTSIGGDDGGVCRRFGCKPCRGQSYGVADVMYFCC